MKPNGTSKETREDSTPETATHRPDEDSTFKLTAEIAATLLSFVATVATVFAVANLADVAGASPSNTIVLVSALLAGAVGLAVMFLVVGQVRAQQQARERALADKVAASEQQFFSRIEHKVRATMQSGAGD